MLRTERISGLIFLSGGKPYGELTRLVHANSYNLYDLTLGPMTASPSNEQEELNFFRMPGSSTFERHFALIDFKGPEENRLLTIRVMNVEGQELWSRTIPAKDLQPSKG
jgi:alkaline phosphatase D